LKYNADVAHPLRRNANNMRKEADKLIPLIPDIVVRSRAEVEAEERRKQAADGEDADESDDEPIMQSRGRKAPGNKGAKGTAKARKSIPGHKEGTPADDHKPPLPINRDIAQLAHEGSDFGADGSQNGFVTPGGPAGSGTPLGAHGSQADLMDLDGPSLNGISFGQALSAAAEEMEDDEEYKIWKQVTKKDRARVALADKSWHAQMDQGTSRVIATQSTC
jgi:transcriptional activator SPT7